jgi:hypothetical protein
MPDGERIEIPPPANVLSTSSRTEESSEHTVVELVETTTKRVPLGRLVHARSGDKGGDANLGVWIPAEHPRRDDAYAWLAGFLDEQAVRALLPEAAELELEIHPLPNLAAVNVVVHGLLGEGVSSSTRLDPQAKGLGEWFRARDADIPEEFL